MSKILFISSGNFKTNPRIFKEFDTFSSSADCYFVGFDFVKNPFQVGMESKKGIFLIDLNRKRILKWLLYSLSEGVCQLIYPITGIHLSLVSIASSKRSLYLIRTINKLYRKFPDRILAHTLQTLYPAFYYYSKWKIPFSFDIEDWHPGEIIEKDGRNERKRRELLMKRILPNAAYITYASPFFKEKLEELLGREVLSNIPNEYVANAFPKDQFKFIECRSEKVQFVWFSQNIAAGRGLELFIPVMYEFKDRIELTLIGNLYSDFKKDFLEKYMDMIQIIPPIPLEELNEKIGAYDVGLASDLSSRDENRDIAITNKIIAYTQAGLYIAATNTRGHTWHMSQFPEHGICIGQNEASIRESIVTIINNIEEIRKNKLQRFTVAQNKLCWEIEGEKVIKLMNKVQS